ncbi:hypothetical protein NL676_019502 [Syzygium grande]|nr:hypothetical protein NL676_019502 [Syzygium grande]
MRACLWGVRTSDWSRDNLGIISCVNTMLQKLPPHLSRRMARESDSLPKERRAETNAQDQDGWEDGFELGEEPKSCEEGN